MGAGGAAGFFTYDPRMGRSSLPLAAIEKRLRAAPQAQPAAAPRAPESRGSMVRPPGQVRIIGGQWKRRLLPVASGPQVPAGLRPTPDRVRETLFNWLGQDLGGWHCVDLCAGTGALGLEAASRGAAQVVLVEQHAALAAQLRKLKAQLQAGTVQVRQADALAVLREMARQQPHSQDLLLLDPPFDVDWYPHALQAAGAVLRDNGYLYLEAPQEWTPEALAPMGWRRIRHLKAGMVHAHLLQPLHGTPAQDHHEPQETPL